MLPSKTGWIWLVACLCLPNLLGVWGMTGARKMQLRDETAALFRHGYEGYIKYAYPAVSPLIFPSIFVYQKRMLIFDHAGRTSPIIMRTTTSIQKCSRFRHQRPPRQRLAHPPRRPLLLTSLTPTRSPLCARTYNNPSIIRPRCKSTSIRNDHPCAGRIIVNVSVSR